MMIYFHVGDWRTSITVPGNVAKGKNGHDSDVVSEKKPACEARKGVKVIKPNRYWRSN